MSDPRLGIGGNNPPEPTPYEAAEREISDLYEEARLWLDGAVVDSQSLADGIGNLLSMLRAATNRADNARKAEVRPLDEAKAKIQERYNALIGNTKTQKGKAVLAMEACKQALTPWLEKIDREKRAAAEKARRDAEEKQRAAQEAIRTAEHSNLAQRAEAEAQIQDAKRAQRAANTASRDTAKAGFIGRVVSLRTAYKPVMTDPVAALRHYRETKPNELKAFLLSLAESDVRSGKQAIPGFEVIEQKQAV